MPSLPSCRAGDGGSPTLITKVKGEGVRRYEKGREGENPFFSCLLLRISSDESKDDDVAQSAEDLERAAERYGLLLARG